MAKELLTIAMTGMKVINYRGGMVRFHVPSHWREEYDPKGGGTFYEDRPDSGTLRLNILGFESEKGEPCEEAAKRAFSAGSFEVLPSGLPLRRCVVEGEEEGVALHFHRWEVAIPVPPSAIRIACFAHTILAGQESDPTISAELALIDHSVRNAEFSREQGVSGDYYPS